MDQSRLYDVIVIGGGPAGLTAGLYLARARYRVLVVEKERFGGQITITEQVVNYPGVAHTSGTQLTETMRQQAQSFGAEFLLAEVTGLDLAGDVKTVRTSRGDLSCFGVLWATGAHPRMVGFQGEEAFRGRGVAYCATCDGEFFTDKEVFVVGGGFAAAEESVFLTKYARHVTILIRGADFSCAQSTAQAARDHEKITVLPHTQVEEVGGDDALRYLRYRNTETGQVTEYRPPAGETFGRVRLCRLPARHGTPPGGGGPGRTGLCPHRPGAEDLRRRPLRRRGCVRQKPLRQVVTAVGDGALAATELEKYAAAAQQRTGLRPQAPQAAPPAGAQTAQGQGTEAGGLFPPEMAAQLQTVFSRMTASLVLELTLDSTPLSQELEAYMQALCRYTDKLTLRTDGTAQDAPCVRVCRADSTWTGLAFHGVPGGHEFTSFVLGLYNAAGPGQALDEATMAAIQAIQQPTDLQILVSLSCTMCPELVTAAQRLAAANPHITAQAYDLNHFPALRDQYKVMSVPCLVVNHGQQVSFGKKSIAQLLDLLS